ncbi:aspartyl protease family protein [Deinococcus hohokamensis]|uniref:Aspartyl protease family protein n=1 Tax=Deinococcus hohokamensis TaxID=309883 RepID=A0ABV9IAS9_9DEIO
MTVTELPLRLVHNRPFVRLRYHGPGGAADAWTWLDTGGGALLLGRGLTQELGLAATGTPTEEQGERLTPVEAPMLSAGGRPLPLGVRQVCATDHDWIAPAAFRAPAFLPAPFFQQFTTTFDFPGGLLRLGPVVAGAVRHAAMGASFHEPSGFFTVELEIAGERLNFLLDTGASYSMVSAALWARWHAPFPEWPVESGSYGTAQMTALPFESAAHMIWVPAARLGGTTLTGLGFVTRPPGVFETYLSALTAVPVVGALAGNALRHLCVTLDPAAGQVGLGSGQGAPGLLACGGDLSGLGLCLRHEGERFFVGAVAGAAYPHTRAQVQPGDEVVAVGGRALAGTDLAEAVDALSAAPGETLAVHLRRGERRLNARLPVVALLNAQGTFWA